MTLAQSLIGIQAPAAATILAEIGTDMSRFPSDKHLPSWAGGYPGNKQSGGKRLSGATPSGNPHLKAVLAEVAWAISHTRGNYLSEQYPRLARRRGKKKAIVAVSHSVLLILYHVLREKKPYQDLGADSFAKLDTRRQERHPIRQLEPLGYTVTLVPKEAV